MFDSVIRVTWAARAEILAPRVTVLRIWKKRKPLATKYWLLVLPPADLPFLTFIFPLKILNNI